MKKIFPRFLGLLCMVAAISNPCGAAEKDAKNTYEQNEVLSIAEEFFDDRAAGLAKVVEKAFKEKGKPSGFIMGEEAGGAIGVGLRYGKGTLKMKNGKNTDLFWQGPSVGFDVGGNASKVFTLVYHMENTEHIFQRFPGVDGSLYIIAGYGINYQQSEKIVLAPIRSGAGLRAGASVGYLHYTREKSWNPF